MQALCFHSGEKWNEGHKWQRFEGLSIKMAQEEELRRPPWIIIIGADAPPSLPFANNNI